MRVDGEELIREKERRRRYGNLSLDRRKDSGIRCKPAQSLQSGPHPGSLRL